MKDTVSILIKDLLRIFTFKITIHLKKNILSRATSNKFKISDYQIYINNTSATIHRSEPHLKCIFYKYLPMDYKNFYL